MPLLILSLLAFFLPFERIGSYDLAGVTIRISQMLILILLGYFFFRFISNKEKISISPIYWLLMLFIGINLLAIKNALNHERALLVVAFTFFIFSLPLLMSSFINHSAELKKIVNWLLIGSLAVTIFGLFQFFGDVHGLPNWLTGLRPQYSKEILGFPRIQSTALEPLYFANYLLIPLAFTLSLIISRFTDRKKKFLLIGLLFLISVNLALTASRGGIIAAFFTAAVTILLMRPKIFSLKTVSLGLILSLSFFIASQTLAASSFDPLQSATDKFISHLTTLTSGAAVEERLSNYRPAWRIWQENFWLGLGPGNFGPALAIHPYLQPSQGWKIVNNETLELLSETGLLGFLTLALFHLLLLVYAFRALRYVSPELKPFLIAGLAAWIGIWIQYQTFSILYITHVWFVAGLLLKKWGQPPFFRT